MSRHNIDFVLKVGRRVSITPTITFYIKPITSSTAIAYFFDDVANNYIAIPANFDAFDVTNRESLKKAKHSQFESYILSWSDDYKFRYNNEEILFLSSQRSWDLISTRKIEVA
jgi:hypothetical protein